MTPQALADALLASGVTVRHVREDFMTLEREPAVIVAPEGDGSFLVCRPPDAMPPEGSDPSKYITVCEDMPQLLGHLIRCRDDH